jgi:hypothetical protein
LRTAAYGSVLAAHVGTAILFTYLRYAEWYDAISRLGIPGIPFFFGYAEALIRGVLLGLLNALGIFLTFRKFSDPDKCRPFTSALWIFVLFAVTMGICFLTQPRAYDPGLAVELIIPGSTATASTWLYAGDVVLQRELPIPDKDIMVKWVELGHKEATDAITSLALVAVAGIAAAGYIFLKGLVPAPYNAVDPGFVWFTIAMNIFEYILVTGGFVLFTMAPLFIRLDILKAKLISMQANAFAPSRKTRLH